MTYSLATDATSKVYKPSFVGNYHNHARQSSSMSSPGRKLLGGSGGVVAGAVEGTGVLEHSLQFKLVIKVDAGISKYVPQATAMKVESEEEPDSDSY